MPEVILFKTEDLLPDAWRHFSTAGPVRAFNPGLLRDERGWIFAYRVVGPDGLRRIGTCRLDESFRIVAGSAVPTSDHVRFAQGRDYPPQATTWFADPRLYRLQGRVFVYWNSGWHEPQNHQFMQELDAVRLMPIGAPRELVLRGTRQALEKNWTFFEHGPQLYAVYSAAPHRMLTVSLASEGDIVCDEFAAHRWTNEAYTTAHGTLRGGTPPQLHEGHYWSFCHSVAGTDGDYRYVAAAYRFAAQPTFAPTDKPTGPLALGGQGSGRTYEKLNPAVGSVTYPCGAAYHAGQWAISFGINDERCALALLSPTEVAAAVQPIDRAG